MARLRVLTPDQRTERERRLAPLTPYVQRALRGEFWIGSVLATFDGQARADLEPIIKLMRMSMDARKAKGQP
jgi:hypothetical protein